MNYYNKISFGRVADIIDKYLKLDDEKKVIEIIDAINRKQHVYDSEVEEIERIFFIWIGNINAKAVEYIDVWVDCFKGRYKIDLYFDSEFLLFGHLKNVFKLYFEIGEDTSADEIILKQNEFYKQINNHILNGKTFDEALICISKCINIDLKENLKLAKIKLRILSQLINVIDIRCMNDVFYNDFLREMYFNELILRHNAACASDILRLSLLYRDGGMYVDVDTLPSHRHVFDGVANAGNLLINDNVLYP